MKAQELSRLTIEEYINHEIETGQRYEYHNGQLYAMSGGTINHGILCGNIYAELRNSLRNKPSACKALTGEVKLHIPSENAFVYPDAMVVCGEMQRSERDTNALTNPTLIVEVLSKTTESYDRGDKFYKYRQIPTLQEYVLIEQEKIVVEIYSKHANTDLWRISRVEGLDQMITFHSLGVAISMKDLYSDVEGL